MLCQSPEGKICLTNALFFLLLTLLGLMPNPLFTRLFPNFARSLSINSNGVQQPGRPTTSATATSEKSAGTVNSPRRSARLDSKELPACPLPTTERKSSVFMR